MKGRLRWVLPLFTLTAGVASSDDITGEDSIICVAWHALVCTTEATCDQSEAWRLDMPDFLKVDLDAGVLSTPERSAEERFAEVESIHRDAGQLILNGWQDRRGFTWVINEASGEGTLAIVTETSVVSLFTACAASEALQ